MANQLNFCQDAFLPISKHFYALPDIKHIFLNPFNFS